MISEVIKFYEDREDVTLTTYVISDSPELLNGKKRPAIIICPGGAYLGCSDREGEAVALRFASMGYHAFVLRYSTYFEGKMGFPELGAELKVNEKCVHPTPMREIGKAILILRENADKWLIDVDKIAICGFSAGAHNCAMYSVYWDKPIISGYFNERPELFRPAAAILSYTLSDYVFMRDFPKGPMEKGLFAAANVALVGCEEPDEEKLIEISPALQVSENTPPMFLWATAEDTLVPVQHTLRMAHALADKKIPFEVHVFEEGAHGLSLSTQATAKAKTQVLPDASKWVSMAEAWLEKRFALPLEEIAPWEAMEQINKEKY
ncbi:alpha/beta hydrolase [Clostridium sp. SYSU_GA19001]|uniref:alpha/beta hydrolase n=1 Tax=Clostridium caldaquaticum TaxID=2940653 RepID=UPI0020778B2A|nr:alpha/beta hydrolase [Clostridium caldaquaticum]MCM8710306.1 alpha/beta hydrolase [Clostridium caldaquaticum]